MSPFIGRLFCPLLGHLHPLRCPSSMLPLYPLHTAVIIPFIKLHHNGCLLVHYSAKFTDDCKFRERFQENSYNTYASAIHRTEKTGREWYVALNKRGKAKRGCSPRVKPQHISTHFLPRFKQSEQPELSFTVTVPEKKKPPSPIKPKVPLSTPRKNTNSVKYRLKFRFG
ncbi:fibroblast growth factor 5 isoform X2 [Symphalangus syndactylus]|uniref:fibroblast growth factor 5 isoform X2 n=1 Tax=Symphalangus syndactylus TaxID=9590 RepID=UPI0030049D69